jgi:glycosyltransferase involved in cell wall biosynthesis
MRVAIDGRALQPGFREHQGRGIGVYAVELVRALACRPDLELTIWHQPELALPEAHVPAGVRVRAYPRLPLPRRDRIAALTTVPASVRGSDHDVFHFLAHTDAPAWRGPGLVITVHDLILEVMGSLYAPRRPLAYRLARGFERRAVSHAVALVADSAITRGDLVSRWKCDPAHVHLAHLGLHPRFAPPPPATVAAWRAGAGLEGPFVLYLGGIDARKNVPGLLRAYARVAAAGNAPDLVLAGRVRGTPEFAPLLALARELGVEARLRFPGFVHDDDLPALHAAAEVFVFPSLYEGFGFPPLEAMACGTPVVSSDGGSLAEVLGEGALLASAGDDGALAVALGRVLGDVGLRADLRARGLANAARYTWARTAEATVAAYRDAVASRGAPR